LKIFRINIIKDPYKITQKRFAKSIEIKSFIIFFPSAINALNSVTAKIRIKLAIKDDIKKN
jgi:hypothetical protein